MEGLFGLILLGAGALVFGLVVFTTFIPIPLYLEAAACGARISLLDLF